MLNIFMTISELLSLITSSLKIRFQNQLMTSGHKRNLILILKPLQLTEMIQKHGNSMDFKKVLVLSDMNHFVSLKSGKIELIQRFTKFLNLCTNWLLAMSWNNLWLHVLTEDQWWDHQNWTHLGKLVKFITLTLIHGIGVELKSIQCTKDSPVTIKNSTILVACLDKEITCQILGTRNLQEF